HAESEKGLHNFLINRLRSGPLLAGQGNTVNRMEATSQAGEIRFLNRELSWIEFNKRVLEEGLDHTQPLLERLKFLSIFSTNLDEFFMIRVSRLQEQMDEGSDFLSEDGDSPADQMQRISERLRPLLEMQSRCLTEEILPELRQQAGVRILSYAGL